MRSSILLGLSFVASAFGLAIVTSPVKGATIAAGTSSALPVSWTTVQSDPTEFQLVLVSDDQKTTISLGTVQTSSGSATVNPPAGFWPSGGFKIYAENLPTTQNPQPGILSQSDEIDISANGPIIASVSTTNVLPTTATTAIVPTAAVVTAATGVATTTATTLEPAAPINSGAMSVVQVSGTLLALIAVAHAFVL